MNGTLIHGALNQLQAVTGRIATEAT